MCTTPDQTPLIVSTHHNRGMPLSGNVLNDSKTIFSATTTSSIPEAIIACGIEAVMGDTFQWMSSYHSLKRGAIVDGRYLGTTLG